MVSVTDPRMGMELDVVTLSVSDEAVVEDHERLQAENLSFDWLQQQRRTAIGEVVTEEVRVLIVLWLWEKRASEVIYWSQNSEKALVIFFSLTELVLNVLPSLLTSMRIKPTLSLFWKITTVLHDILINIWFEASDCHFEDQASFAFSSRHD